MVSILRLLFAAVAVTASPLVQRDAITVENDVTQQIGPQLQTLYEDLSAFPDSGLAGALTIHNDAQKLVSTVNAATDNVKSTGSFGAVSGTTILAEIQLLVPTLLATAATIGTQESSWESIPGGKALVLSDLQDLKGAFTNYLNSIIAAQPILQKAPALAIKAQVSGAFTTAINAYTS